MILFDISLFFLDSLNPVTVAEVIAAVFLAERVAAGEGLGCSTSSGRRVAPTPVGRCPAPEAPAGGRELQLVGQSWECPAPEAPARGGKLQLLG